MISSRNRNVRDPMNQPPFVLRWDGVTAPVPRVAVRGGRKPAGFVPAPGWIDTGPVGQPFDFCASMSALVEDVARHVPEFAHLDTTRMAFTFTQARNTSLHGLQARVTPLRFQAGQLRKHSRGLPWQVQRFLIDGREILYVVSFCLPRFFDRDFDDKFVTVFHELYHISEAFDGDLRRHGGRYSIHTHSQKQYDQSMAGLAREYLMQNPRPMLYEFLRLNFAQLQHRHGRVLGLKLPRPQLLPLRKA